MSWFKVSDGRLRYRGRIRRQPFAAWAATEDGRAAIDAAARQLGFCLLGRTRTARRAMWRELQSAVTSAPMRAVLESEADRYLATWTELAYAPALPRLQVSLRRLVVVPRTMIAARSLSGFTARAMSVPEFAALDGPLRTFFASRVLAEMDDAIRRAAPSPSHPVHARESWACVGIDERFTWVDPLWSGREWQGHVMMFEMPNARPSRRERNEIGGAIERLQQSLPTMSIVDRDGAVRRASAGVR